MTPQRGKTSPIGRARVLLATSHTIVGSSTQGRVPAPGVPGAQRGETLLQREASSRAGVPALGTTVITAPVITDPGNRQRSVHSTRGSGAGAGPAPVVAAAAAGVGMTVRARVPVGAPTRATTIHPAQSRGCHRRTGEEQNQDGAKSVGITSGGLEGGHARGAQEVG